MKLSDFTPERWKIYVDGKHKTLKPLVIQLEEERAEYKRCWSIERAERRKLEAENESLNKRYYGLLLSVESVHSGETRHETALRYIQEAEQGSDDAADAQPTRKDE